MELLEESLCRVLLDGENNCGIGLVDRNELIRYLSSSSGHRVGCGPCLDLFRCLILCLGGCQEVSFLQGGVLDHKQKMKINQFHFATISIYISLCLCLYFRPVIYKCIHIFTSSPLHLEGEQFKENLSTKMYTKCKFVTNVPQSLTTFNHFSQICDKIITCFVSRWLFYHSDTKKMSKFNNFDGNMIILTILPLEHWKIHKFDEYLWRKLWQKLWLKLQQKLWQNCGKIITCFVAQ